MTRDSCATNTSSSAAPFGEIDAHIGRFEPVVRQHLRWRNPQAATLALTAGTSAADVSGTSRQTRATMLIMSFARQNRYAAAYTHRTPSRDDELVKLASWVTSQPGSGLTLIGVSAKSLERSNAAQALVKRGATFTYARARGWQQPERIIAMWPDRKTLGEVDAIPGTTALGVLTWNLDEVLPWAAGVAATDVLDEAPQTTGPASIDDPMTLGALRSITDAANLSTGLAHTSDFDTALAALKELQRRGRTLDRDAIEAWAVAAGWSYRHAHEDLGELVAELNAGKRKRFKSPGTTRRTTSSELVDYWLEIGSESDWKAL